jgi:hypothetical protein
MKTIAYLVKRPHFDANPASNYFMQCSRLDEVIRQAEKYVVAPHDLKPLELPLTDLEHSHNVAGDVGIHSYSIFAWQVDLRIPDLEHYLTRLRVHDKRTTRVSQLIQPKMGSQAISVSAMIDVSIARILWELAIEPIYKA